MTDTASQATEKLRFFPVWGGWAETKVTDRKEIFNNGKHPTSKNHSDQTAQRSAPDKIIEKLFIPRCVCVTCH